MRAFGTDGRRDTGAKIAWRSEIARNLGKRRADLAHFLERRLINFFLRVKASPHGPFVEQVQEGACLDETDGLGIWKKVKREFERDAAIQQFVLSCPRLLHR